MDEKTLSFLRQVYREHYFKHHDLIEVPEEMASREFGYIPFDGGMIRHLSFKNGGELSAELVKQAPSSVYCSNATYERPTLQMDEKGMAGGRPDIRHRCRLDTDSLQGQTRLVALR